MCLFNLKKAAAKSTNLTYSDILDHQSFVKSPNLTNIDYLNLIKLLSSPPTWQT